MNNDKFLEGVIAREEEGLCGFIRCWIGKCENVNCKLHKDLKCKCGSKATHDCPETHGAFVCGRDLCGSCSCSCRNC